MVVILLCQMLLLLGQLLMLSVIAAGVSNMEVLYSWKTPDFAFLSNDMREAYINSGKFIPINNAIIDADIWRGQGKEQKVIVTLPKFKPGIPVTLAKVTKQKYHNTTLLSPYPDWTWHKEGDCDGITSVFRTEVDKCGRLWVLDCGAIDIYNTNKQICPPQVLVFDLHSDKLVDRYRFPDGVLDSNALLTTIIVDTRDKLCKNSFVYIADVKAFKLIVLDAARKISWKIASNLFFPFPLGGEYNINGVSFDRMDGVFGIALGPLKDGDRMLYFHSLASFRESWVNTSIIRNSSLFENGINASPRSFQVFDGKRNSQSAAEAMTDNGILFFGLLNKNAMACWNSRLPYNMDNIVITAQDNTTLQFPSGVKIYDKYVVVLTTRLQNYMMNKVVVNEDNYRIMVSHVSDLIRHTQCDTTVPIPSHHGSGYYG